MIGQTDLINILTCVIDEGKLPKFIIFVGAKGSGKKTLVQEVISPMYDCIYVPDNKIESIRQMIDTVYKVHYKVFVMWDVDNMSLAAKNALLKVIEECPNNNRFIMTLEDESHTLETIRSRAVIYHMDRYRSKEIIDYALEECIIERCDYDEIDIIRNLCETPGEVQLLDKMGIKDFYSYVQKVADNIGTVSGANAFKIADKISFKEDDGKYDLKIFWKAFCSVCIEKFKDVDKPVALMHAKWCRITSKYMSDLVVTGINKQMLFDNWLLEIRQIWLDYGNN